MFWDFRRLKIHSFFESNSWCKDDIYWILKSSCFELFTNWKYSLFSSQKVDGKMTFTKYRKVLNFCFELFRDEIYGLFRAKKLMERWYLLITGKFLFWTFQRWEIRSFFEWKSWWKDDIYLVFLSFPWYSRTWEIWFCVQWYVFQLHDVLTETLLHTWNWHIVTLGTLKLAIIIVIFKLAISKGISGITWSSTKLFEFDMDKASKSMIFLMDKASKSVVMLCNTLEKNEGIVSVPLDQCFEKWSKTFKDSLTWITTITLSVCYYFFFFFFFF